MLPTDTSPGNRQCFRDRTSRDSRRLGRRCRTIRSKQSRPDSNSSAREWELGGDCACGSTKHGGGCGWNPIATDSEPASATCTTAAKKELEGKKEEWKSSCQEGAGKEGGCGGWSKGTTLNSKYTPNPVVIASLAFSFFLHGGPFSILFFFL
ncbi:hypothetical protein BDR26DRAFT_16370 [Obelidium mucronatum]|nr:hypothetical protein BDR26DRAFT_16370 [Obelidium mucronatum]